MTKARPEELRKLCAEEGVELIKQGYSAPQAAAQLSSKHEVGFSEFNLKDWIRKFTKKTVADYQHEMRMEEIQSRVGTTMGFLKIKGYTIDGKKANSIRFICTCKACKKEGYKLTWDAYNQLKRLKRTDRASCGCIQYHRNVDKFRK